VKSVAAVSKKARARAVEACKMREAGMKYREIGEALGCNIGKALRLCDRGRGYLVQDRKIARYQRALILENFRAIARALQKPS